ncbi:MAG: hypothetical protein AB7F83_15735 [Lysobacterales bacterium]
MQTAIATLAVLLAIAYLGRRWFGQFRARSRSDACSGCAQCDAGKDRPSR